MLHCNHLVVELVAVDDDQIFELVLLHIFDLLPGPHEFPLDTDELLK